MHCRQPDMLEANIWMCTRPETCRHSRSWLERSSRPVRAPTPVKEKRPYLGPVHSLNSGHYRYCVASKPGPARPSEPILIPKLRIEFADFPYLHVSGTAEATNLGYRMRI